VRVVGGGLVSAVVVSGELPMVEAAVDVVFCGGIVLVVAATAGGELAA